MSSAAFACSAFSPVIFANTIARPLSGWQAAVADAFARGDRRIAVLAGRQLGKSEVAGLIAIWIVLYEGGTVAIIAQHQQAAAELLARIKATLLAVMPSEMELTKDSSTELEIDGDRHRRIVCKAGSSPNSARGLDSIRLLIIDEAAYVGDETWAAVTPIIARNPRGQIIALSTPSLDPAARAGWFTAAMSSPTLKQDWTRFRFSAESVGGLPAGVLAMERRSMSDLRFRAEFLADLSATNHGQAFTDQMLDAATDDELEPWSFLTASDFTP